MGPETGTTSPLKIKVMGIIFLVIGAFILKMGISASKDNKKKAETYIETMATVSSYAYNDEDLRAIIVEYEVDGQKYTKKSDSYSNAPKSLGTKVSIKYNPDDPKDAIWTKDSGNTILIIFGVVFSIVGLVAIVKGNPNAIQNQY